MKAYKVEFYVEVPDDTPIDDLEKFFRFELGEVGTLHGDNALARKDLQSLVIYGIYAREA